MPTTSPAAPTVATEASEDVQLPPETVDDRVIELPWQTTTGPDNEPAVGVQAALPWVETAVSIKQNKNVNNPLMLLNFLNE